MDHHAILSWADGHLNRLEVSITAFMKQYPYTLRPDYDDTSLDHTTMVITIGPFEPPDDWVFQIGDALHNMRVALDYLAYRVVTKHSSIVDEDQVAFPIFDDPVKFNARAGRSLKGVPSGIRDAFERLQPYPGRSRFGFNILLLLSELENVHKHRHLLATFPGVDSMTFEVFNDPSNVVKVERLRLPDGPLVDGTVVARYRFNGNRKAEVKSHTAFQIFFDKTTAGGGMAVLRTLKNMRKFIGEVIFPEFDAILKRP